MISPTGNLTLTTVTKSKITYLSRSITRAFTLIELIFVLVLMVLVAGFAIPKLSSILALNQKSSVFKLAGFLQRAHQMSILRGKNFRIVLDMDEKSFWIEETVPPQTKPLLPEEFKVDDVLVEFRKEAEDFMDEEEVEKRKLARYQVFEAKGISKTSLPSPIYIESVYLSTLKERINEGLIYIPISRSGYHPTSIIYIGVQDEVTYSLVFPSLSSQVRIEKGETNPEEIQW